ncbi:MAG TPA: type II toxin-antitoxin system death-on-curing family toxin [Casimicrobiaceae bacterium]|nr:type II toxin-antitoxin system death-on-curing family toxin [Casimicrobiaceae bacterium]
MTRFTWLASEVIISIHEAQLAEHGGTAGTRDVGLLKSALARPRNLHAYKDPDFADLAAAYGFGIARNHPFVDGNKRTAYVAVELFLDLNGDELLTDDSASVLTMLALAAGDIDEATFAGWIRAHSRNR